MSKEFEDPNDELKPEPLQSSEKPSEGDSMDGVIVNDFGDDTFDDYDGESDVETKSSFRSGERDPLGYLILPIFALVLIGVVVLWFMQKKKDDGPEFYPVTGRVTHNGGPLEGTFQITFFPLSENNEEIASGRLFEDGTYKLFSGQLGVSGARAGEYRVCVRRIREKGEDEYMNFDMKTTKVDPRDGGTMTPEEPKTPFDKAVTDPKKTPHRAVVVEGDNVIDVQL